MVKLKDATPLITDWLSPTIINREEEKQKLGETIFNPLVDEQGIPRCVYIYGGSGSGKTFVIKKQIGEKYKTIKKHLPNFEYHYINLKEQGIPSYHTVLMKINVALKKYLPITAPTIGIVEDIPWRGWDKNIHLEVMKEIIRQKKVCLLLVIDEVDRLVAFEKNDDFIYAFAEMYTAFDDLFSGITAVFVSNDVTLLNRLEEKTRQRIPFFIHFKPYNMTDLYRILEVTASHAVEGEIDKVMLSAVAGDVANTTKSAREAKLLLYNFINTNDFVKARLETDKDMLREDVRRLSFHQLLAMHAVVQRYEDIENMQKRSNPSRYKNIDKPTAGSIYEHYVKTCSKVDESAKTYKTFHRLIAPLDKDGILRLDVTSLGRARGITTLIYPGESTKIMKPLLNEFCPLPRN